MATLQDYLGITKLRDAWPKWKANVIAVNNELIALGVKYVNHVAGTVDKHAAENITYSGSFTGKTEVKAALAQAKAEIDLIVVSASIDPEVAFARESLAKGETFATLDARLEEIETDVITQLAEYVSVKQFGAKGDGITDDTISIQDAIDNASITGVGNLGAIVYFPPGVYKISTSLTVLANKFVSFSGAGKVSTISWFGTNNLPILAFNDGNDEMQLSIEKLRFLNGNSSTGLIGIQTCKIPGKAFVNASIRKCLFENLAIAIETWTETDQLTFVDNYVLGYATAGIWARGGTNSNYHIRDNHFRGGAANSWGIKHDGGTNILIDGNTIQTAASGAKGISLSNVSSFSIKNTYFEVASETTENGGPFLSLNTSVAGIVEVNHTAGNCGLSIITVDSTCSNINFGPNGHGISGGTPARFINIAEGAVAINILAEQIGVNPYSGPVSIYIASDSIYTSIPISQYSGYKNIDPYSTGLLFAIEPNTAYFVHVRNSADNACCMGIIQKVQTYPATAFTINASKAYLTIAANGDSLQVSNDTVATRTIKYSAFRMF